MPDTELLEYVCQENERSRQRMIGTLDDDREAEVLVAPEVLARYSGTYLVEILDDAVHVTVSVREGKLTLDIERDPRITALATSDTHFAAGGVAVEFVPGPDDVVSELF